MREKRILLKITGRLFCNQETEEPDGTLIDLFLQDIKKRQIVDRTHQFGIVVGGGNLFRGAERCKGFNLSAAASHEIGILATVMNGLIIAERARELALPLTHFCGISVDFCGVVFPSVDQIEKAIAAGHVLLFSGGTGVPFFTTDTAAVIRGLQMRADEIWKGTDVDAVYSCDPKSNLGAEQIKQLSYQEALDKNIRIMDQAAYVLCQKNKLKTRIFSIIKPGAVERAAVDETFGTEISF